MIRQRKAEVFVEKASDPTIQLSADGRPLTYVHTPHT